MRFNKNLLTATLLTVAGLIAVSSANAASPATGSFGVDLQVESICTINATDLDVSLANIEAGQAQVNTPLSVVTQLVLNCSKGATATVSLTPRSTSTLDGTGELLRDGLALATEKVGYKLTSVSATGTAWGTTNKVSVTDFANYETAKSTPIYLTVTDNADVSPGNYSDVIDISVAY